MRCLNLLSLCTGWVLPLHSVVISKACCFQQGYIWAQGKSCSGKLWDRGWRLWASRARIIFLLHVHIMPTIRRVDYGLRMWDTAVRLIGMEEDKHAVTIGGKKKKITIITKIFVITKENFAHALQSPPWKALQEKRRWERVKKRGKTWSEEAEEEEKNKDWDRLNTFNLSQYNTSF